MLQLLQTLELQFLHFDEQVMDIGEIQKEGQIYIQLVIVLQLGEKLHKLDIENHQILQV